MWRTELSIILDKFIILIVTGSRRQTSTIFCGLYLNKFSVLSDVSPVKAI